MTDISKLQDNDGYHGQNIEFDVAAEAADVTINVSSSGTETATTKYLDKGAYGKGFVLRPDKTVKIVSIGGRTFRDPITVSTAGWAQTTHIPDFDQIVIRTTTTSTHIKLFVM